MCNPPSRGVVGFSGFREKDFTRGRGIRGRGVESPVRVMLWNICNRVLCFLIIYYVHISDLL